MVRDESRSLVQPGRLCFHPGGTRRLAFLLLVLAVGAAAPGQPDVRVPFDVLNRNYPNFVSVETVKRLIGGGLNDLDAPPDQQ
jgi:hypothetical protein